MKKFTAFLIITLLAAAMLVPVSAADKTVITLQPQNSVYPEFASAIWSVGATGENLSYNWYIVYNGTAYRTVDSFAGRDTAPTKPGIPSLSKASEAHLTAR